MIPFVYAHARHADHITVRSMSTRAGAMPGVTTSVSNTVRKSCHCVSTSSRRLARISRNFDTLRLRSEQLLDRIELGVQVLDGRALECPQVLADHLHARADALSDESGSRQRDAGLRGKVHRR